MNFLFVTIPKLGRRFARSKINYLKLLLQLWYFALSRRIFGFTTEFQVSANYRGKQITFYLKYFLDLAVLKEVFLDEEYLWEYSDSDPKVVLDIGAHFGDSSLFYHALYPDARIIAVEPSPENFARLVKHVEKISNIIPVNAAVGLIDGEITLNLTKSSLGHSVVSRGANSSSVKVSQLSIESLKKKIDIEKVDLIKFDIEGGEFGLLNNPLFLQSASAFIGELHFDIVSSFTESDIKDLLAINGFTFTLLPLEKKGRYIIRASKIKV